MSQAEPYHYVRFAWHRGHSVGELVEMFEGDFDLTFNPRENMDDTYDLSLFRGHRWEILLKADTLSAFLSTSRAILFQKGRHPFTKKDMELRRIVLKLYPHARPTPFPWLFGHEPPFEIEER